MHWAFQLFLLVYSPGVADWSEVEKEAAKSAVEAERRSGCRTFPAQEGIQVPDAGTRSVGRNG